MLAHNTLFRRYAVHFSVLVSVLLVLSGAVAAYFTYRQSLDALDVLQLQKARFAASEIDGFVARIEDALGATSRKFTRHEQIDPDDLTIEFIALLRHHPSITDVAWIAPDGREELSLSRIAMDAFGSGRDRSQDESFKATRVNDKFVGPVYFRDETEPYVGFAIARGPTRSALVAQVNLRFMEDAIARLVGADGTTAYVVDAAGRLVSHPDRGLVLGKTDMSTLPHVHRMMQRKEAQTSTGATRGGDDVVVAAVPIERLGWMAFVEQSQSVALRAAVASLEHSIAIVVLGVVAAILTSVAFARRMVRPIREIEAAAREIGDGRLDRRITIETGDELQSLAEQFNRMAERRELSHANLEARIAERTRELTTANEAKSRFLAAASHDLRQPVHALALFVEQLQEKAQSSDQDRVLVARVQRSVDALQELLEALLDLSQLDMNAVTPNLQVYPAQDLLAWVTAHCAPEAEAKGLALTYVPTSLRLRSDPLLLARILLNIVVNAIRYTTEGRVLLGCRRRGASVDIVVADTGIGIAEHHLGKVFEEFYRVAPGAAESEGLGLGLAIVKRLAALLNHPVSIESRPHKGTVVRVTVPRVPGEMALDDAIASKVATRDTVRPALGSLVLVVDDDPAPRDAIESLLRQWGCSVIAVASADEAIACTKGRRPDLVLCDVRLARGESGLDVVDRLRRLHGAELPCSFVTAASDPALISELRARGHHVLFKPTKPAKLRALVEQLVAEKQA